MLGVIRPGTAPRLRFYRRSRRNANMLGTEAHRDQPRRDAPEPRYVVEQAHRPGRRDRFIRAENAVDDPLLDQDLYPLRRSRRKGAAALHRLEVGGRDTPFSK